MEIQRVSQYEIKLKFHKEEEKRFKYDFCF